MAQSMPMRSVGIRSAARIGALCSAAVPEQKWIDSDA